MIGVNSDNFNVLQGKYTSNNVNCQCDKSQSGIAELNFSEENDDHSYSTQLFCKKIKILLYFITAGLLMAILLFTIRTMITVQNIDMLVRLHYKIHKVTPNPLMESMSESSPEYVSITEAIPTTAIVRREALQIVPREQWNAAFPKDVIKLIGPVDIIIICHTATQNCNTSTACEKLIKSMQRYHMEEQRWWDIGYNFIVGGDGKVYEGRGWTGVGSHTFGYNRKSLGIAITGDFKTKIPYKAQIKACKELIKMGVMLGYIDKNYKLFGASQLVSTLSPGKALLEEMETWPEFSEKA
ncbi:peptidoglycan recognition protein-like [Agrilus planipennis]|uniref:Peptidoglycan recognition protein-like n=1 Tax=Agrilus planipennis TaxID=224129 RepID=A0A1W4XFA2_AGRPL|nr:peptidoglycan recognition protein-like [Agrilus planipennis]